MPSEIPHLIMCKILFPWVIIELSMQNTVWHHVWTRVENEVIIEWYCSIKYYQPSWNQLQLQWPYPQYTEYPFFFFYVSSLRHSMDSMEMLWKIFILEISMTSKTSFNNSILLVLPAAQVLAYNSEFCGSWKFNLPNVSVVFPYISWDKYLQAYVLSMVVLFSQWPL